MASAVKTMEATAKCSICTPLPLYQLERVEKDTASEKEVPQERRHAIGDKTILMNRATACTEAVQRIIWRMGFFLVRKRIKRGRMKNRNMLMTPIKLICMRISFLSYRSVTSCQFSLPTSTRNL